MAREAGGHELATNAAGIGVAASVALNLAALALYLSSRFFRDDGEKKETASKTVTTEVAPSSGKPPVTPDSTVNLDHGDPTMFEAFWRGPMGDGATLVIPGWQTMSYFSDVAGLCWFLEPWFEREVRRLYRLVGNAAAADDGYHVLVGIGSMQLFQAALYALSPPAAGAPVSAVSPAPYYSVTKEILHAALRLVM